MKKWTRSWFTLSLTIVAVSAIAQNEPGAPFQGPPGAGPRNGQGPGMAGRPGMGQRQGMRMGQPGLPPLGAIVTRPDVQAEIRITPDQLEKLKEVMQGALSRAPQGGEQGRPPRFGEPGPGGQGDPNRQGGQRGQGGQRPNMAPGQMPNREEMEKRRKEHEAQIKAIFSDPQNRRLREIQIQEAGLSAVFDAGIQKEIGVTAEQKAKIDALRPQPMGGRGGFAPGGPGGPPPQGGPGGFEPGNQGGPPQGPPQGAPGGFGPGGQGGPPQGGPPMRAGRGGFGPGGPNPEAKRLMEENLGKILTQAQKDQLKAMGGKPFKNSR